MIYAVRASCSPAVRNHIRSCDHDHPANDIGNGQIPRHAEQCARIHETARSAESPQRTCHGLCGLNVGHDQRVGYGKGGNSQSTHRIAIVRGELIERNELLLPTSVSGAKLLSERHESRHLRSSESESVQRASGLSPCVGRLLTCVGHALYDVPFGTGRFTLSHWRKY